MKRNAHAATAPRPNRILIALAAIWMAASFAIGGAVTTDLRADRADAPAITRTASQP